MPMKPWQTRRLNKQTIMHVKLMLMNSTQFEMDLRAQLGRLNQKVDEVATHNANLMAYIEKREKRDGKLKALQADSSGHEDTGGQ